MAHYDLIIMIDQVLRVTEQPFVYYVGHSQGTEIMFARLASDPHFNTKIRKFFALAPVAGVGHIRGFFAFLANHFGNDLRILTKMFGTHEFLAHTWLSKLFAVAICGPRFMNPLCDNVLFQIGGPEINQFNQSRLLVYLSHTPAGTSTRNIVHWAQMAVNKKIQKFDYGDPEKNLSHYGQESLTKVIPEEYVKLATSLKDFNHFDFIWGLRAPDEIYKGIIATIRDDQMRHSNRPPGSYHKEKVHIV
ncbi:CBN-LIPL-6 protein [Aphelenchoides avenae]|nr:CBN-LIPL-6 protein [Aphelenchus avenae]